MVMYYDTIAQVAITFRFCAPASLKVDVLVAHRRDGPKEPLTKAQANVRNTLIGTQSVECVNVIRQA